MKHPTLHIEIARAERKKRGRIASEGGVQGMKIDLRQLKVMQLLRFGRFYLFKTSIKYKITDYITTRL